MFNNLELNDSKLETNLLKLIDILKGYQKIIVAYSGGVDSTLLAFIASKVLKSNSFAVTVNSEFIAQDELAEAVELGKTLQVNHKVIEVSVLSNSQIIENTPLRCKFCKEAIVLNLRGILEDLNFSYIIDGTNLDDTGDYRPGSEAAKSLGVKSPFLEAGIGKFEIRKLAKTLNIPNWNKPAAACLASRIPYETVLTKKILLSVEQAEFYIKSLGYKGFRVRHHDNIARIELDFKDIAKFISEHKDQVVNNLKKYGYNYVCLDLTGYRTGSMNEVINKETVNATA